MTLAAAHDLPPLIPLLANEVRWGLLRALIPGDRQVNELVELARQPMNLVSYHLKKLREVGIVVTRRSEADARDVYYSLDMARLHALYVQTGAALHPGFTTAGSSAATGPLHKPLRVLVLCTHNSARSQMAEGFFRHMAPESVTVTSAGSHPTRVHRDAIAAMAAFGVDISSYQSKGFDAVQGKPDYVITVCDKAREICPTFSSGTQQLHWGFPDPTIIADAAERTHAFAHTAQQLRTRISYFMAALPAATEDTE
ncbi:MAG: helix-turn-helix domain-containing protein [Pleurocapsa minor GSE-CHR-MK-17-07R]|jgi:protein-tyrosine-phosphatase/DNA-binding transcriptional ArsR family regulator|nr:helix-turn-helix domain-containing protein [Pleurocapsa minor GSE-CHR-MK 17-07R]